jgi:hypothetical protein
MLILAADIIGKILMGIGVLVYVKRKQRRCNKNDHNNLLY